MQHKERRIARRYDEPSRRESFTKYVYSSPNDENRGELEARANADARRYTPAPSEYRVLFGEVHGHSNLSDGKTDIDDYFTTVRDVAGLDFCALTDHDHGGLRGATIFGEKWEKIRETVKKYNEPGVFTTILAYERDSYPWYVNMIVYYGNYDGEPLRGEQDGEITREELHRWLAREDLLLVPHDTSTISWGTDFQSLDLADMTPLIQVYSRYNYSERRDLSMMFDSDCEGGHWQDALNRGAKMGCIAGSDDHGGTNGLILADKPYPHCYPGITGVWAKENTLPAIFEALRARRCYGFMGGRITLDFRINGHMMGEEIGDSDERVLFYRIEADGELDTVTVVKNGRDYIVLQKKSEMTLFDYRKEQAVDYYYVRARLKDGRMAWSSPIWVGELLPAAKSK